MALTVWTTVWGALTLGALILAAVVYRQHSHVPVPTAGEQAATPAVAALARAAAAQAERLDAIDASLELIHDGLVNLTRETAASR